MYRCIKHFLVEQWVARKGCQAQAQHQQHGNLQDLCQSDSEAVTMYKLKCQSLKIKTLSCWSVLRVRVVLLSCNSGPLLAGSSCTFSPKCNLGTKVTSSAKITFSRKCAFNAFSLKWGGDLYFHVFPKFKWLKYGFDFDDIWLTY